MDKRVIVSGGGKLRAFSVDDLTMVREAALEGAGALCAGAGAVYCADGGAVWRLDADTLVPRALFAGGPGVCDMKLSADGERLYVLCGGADSVLMLSAAAGTPLLLNRAGVNPRRMALDASGEALAVAGGRSERVILLCARTLDRLCELAMPGPVYDVAFGEGAVYALCLGGALQSQLVAVRQGGGRSVTQLAGMPGALYAGADALYAAVHGRLYRAAGTAAVRCLRVSGCAGRLACAGGRWLICDAHTQTLRACASGGDVRHVCAQAEDMTVL